MTQKANMRKGGSVYYRSLKEQLSELLSERNWNWYDLAHEMDLSTGRISHIVNGEGKVSIDTIEKMADVMNVEPEHFDLYVIRKLGEIAVSAPALIQVGRKLLKAKDMTEFSRINGKIASCA
jgi:transcriptional regulator with XRE-family HTH domain